MTSHVHLALIALMFTAVVGCKRTASTDAPSSGGMSGGAPPAVTTTQPLPATTQAAPAGRAVAEPGRGGPVIINGSGPGSPGTR